MLRPRATRPSRTIALHTSRGVCGAFAVQLSTGRPPQDALTGVVCVDGCRYMKQKKAKVDTEEAQRIAGTTDADTELGNASELESALDADEEPQPSPRASSPGSPPPSPHAHDMHAASPRPGVRLAPLASPRLAPLPQGT